MRCRRSPIKSFVCVCVAFFVPLLYFINHKTMMRMYHNASKVSALLHIILIDAMKAVMLERAISKL